MVSYCGFNVKCCQMNFNICLLAISIRHLIYKEISVRLDASPGGQGLLSPSYKS